MLPPTDYIVLPVKLADDPHEFLRAVREPAAFAPLVKSVLAPAPMAGADWASYRNLMLWPILIATALLLVLEGLDGNRLIADHIYDWGGGQWLLRRHAVTSFWIHPGGKYLSLLLWCTALTLWWRAPKLSAWRRSLRFLWLATLLATCVISLLKLLTNIDCPWDMQLYGGARPYFDLFEARPAWLHASGCFPSGHASAGYAWVALYFFFADVRPQWRFAGLFLGLALGLVFGISQQLRGAHFASHDVAALLVCWLTALLVHAAMRNRATVK
jgi:membrane-associated PAP2 superfamily phosphatase